MLTNTHSVRYYHMIDGGEKKTNDFKEPLAPQNAKRIIRDILENGILIFSSPHALDEMKKDNLTELDIVNVLRAGRVDEPEFEKGQFRYRFYSQKVVAIVSFRSLAKAIVVTAWKIKSRGKWR